ncbi:MAG: HEAT repeat domain-containing protein, partial [Solirubrobacterales bacterium]
MDRFGRLVEATTFSFVLLLILVCGETAQPRSAPLLTNPAPSAKPVTTDDLQTQARQIISEGLADTNPQIRANAIEVVATTRDIRLMPKVQKLLVDPVVPVRFAAILAVGDM